MLCYELVLFSFILFLFYCKTLYIKFFYFFSGVYYVLIAVFRVTGGYGVYYLFLFHVEVKSTNFLCFCT